jgi:RecB family exonuclease
MAMNLIKGPIGSGKTSHLLGEFERLGGGGRCTFVVPTSATAVELRRHWIKTHDASMGPVFISWPRFMEEVAGPALPVLSKTHATMLVLEVLGGLELSYFRYGRPSFGIASSFADTILRLKKNLIDVKRLRKILDTRGGQKENDLLRTFEAYERRKSSIDVIDQGDVFASAVERISNGRSKFLNGKAAIFIDEFHSFSPGEIDALLAMHDGLGGIELFISFPTPETGDEQYAKYLSENIRPLEAMADSAKVMPAARGKGHAVKIMRTRSPLQELRLARRIIAGALADGGVSWDELIIATRRPSSFAGELIDEFFIGCGWQRRLAQGELGAPMIHGILSQRSTDRWPAAATLSQYISCCKESASSFMVKNSFPFTPDAASTLTSAYRLKEVLDDIELMPAIASDIEMSRESFVQMLKEELRIDVGEAAISRFMPIGHIPFDSGLAVPRRRVIVPQAAEGHIPSSHSERPFFSDVDTLSVKGDDAVDRIFTSDEEAIARDSYLLDTFIKKCREEVCLTFSIIDASGSEVMKSSLLDGMPDAVDVEPLLDGHALTKRDEERLAKKVEIETDRFGGDMAHPSYQGRLVSRDALKIISERFSDGLFSASRLEKYAECPFRFFVEKVLGLEPIEEEIPELIPKDRGTIFHRVLEKFFGGHADEFRAAVDDEGLEKSLFEALGRIVDDVLAASGPMMAHVAPGLRDRQRDAIRLMARQVVKMELAEKRTLPSPLFPAKCEWGFGVGDVPPLGIAAPEGRPAKFHGYIDRVDVDSSGKHFLVVDYKTGTNVKSVKQDLLHGRKLQLPIYVAAVKKLLFRNAVALGGLLIDVLKAEKKHGFVRKGFDEVHYSVGGVRSAMKDEEWDDVMEAALKWAAEYAMRIRRGEFDSRPSKSCPQYCDYADICRYAGRSVD